jgi:phosphopantothenoylcysteine synthetase/decarboxylase
MVNLLLGFTGSVATIKAEELIKTFLSASKDLQIRVILTENSKHFFPPALPQELVDKVEIFTDSDEWKVSFLRIKPH